MRFHLRLEEAKAVAAFRLGLVKRQIRMLDQSVGVGVVAVLRRDCDADAGSDVERTPVEIKRLPDLMQDAITAGNSREMTFGGVVVRLVVV